MTVHILTITYTNDGNRQQLFGVFSTEALALQAAQDEARAELYFSKDGDEEGWATKDAPQRVYNVLPFELDKA